MFAIVQEDFVISVSIITFYQYQMLCVMYQKNLGAYLPLYFLAVL